MDATIHCPVCSQDLHVPANASGHRARCPACGEVFAVPDLEDMLEDTVSGWIVDDVDAFEADAGREVERKLRPQPDIQPDRDDAAGDPAPDGSMSPSDRADMPKSRGETRITGAKNWLKQQTKKKAGRASGRRPHASGQSAGTPAFLKHKTGSDAYPDDVMGPSQRPYLLVRKVDSAGVRFAFDAGWLQDPGFRTSMPMRCAFSGSSDREHLSARPLVFIDRSRAHKATAESVQSSHECHRIGDASAQSLMERMGTIEMMPSPFMLPMPYYVGAKYAHMALHCVTRNRSSDDAVTCEVVVPDAVTALDWLARVNGVCGPEYRYLEHDVSLLHGEAWKSLGEQVRTRISA